MKFRILAISALIAFAGMGISSCKKAEYNFGELKTPGGLSLTATVAGVNAANPNGAGTGNVAITASATNVITYRIDFGDGTTQTVPSGTINYKYNNPGTFTYTIVVTAIGTGGVTSVTSKTVTVFVAYTIPDAIVSNLTGGTSKVWITDNLAPGHVGVGPADAFTPSYYAADPNQRDPCLYDDLMTFTKNSDGTISLVVDNKGTSFLTGGSTTFYGKTGGDGCYTLDLSAPRKLAFMDATSASTSANSTRVQFTVPGNGLVAFGTGGSTYEILSLTATTIHLRNIGSDGLSWYQKFKVKP
ncbi:PKD domain-containing protein [Mucilaginibacter myungsuensis]|uniref:PKD domain-containing protein n=1 Tax=Mucilaginibacter myungsuensis TaxID=649104 RepID=A0A929PZK5_9SPHI|nr:PKD domain-containing protein [Mucilaginibacter myungsuensis]MBE9664595.1 PKD domain-containing protein [Mucilaginibacter myungsuensis]MDN3601055.1 PKD domain-containing protein [Mucilaginibacter myungsuensis]